ncbi:bile acid:sodium symporter family protein [Haloferula rosea]|uniref:Bile acid:sodium symporter family protein n=1 Tax=Haloferula rosea TaxID=490093 RepID=A0A934VEW0_9BACT|nr:bile acid:sodium symporter family protein [Haloferula rosea]
MRICRWIAVGFPLWVVLGCAWAWFFPDQWAWVGPLIKPGLGVIMLGMGLTLRVQDFQSVIRHPVCVLIGVAAQFTVMPASGWLLATTFGLEPGLAIGLILVSCCPGGTASNVVCYLARANVPLSVLMTMTSTFTAVVMTPLLTKWLAGSILNVDAWGLFKSMIQIVLLPLVAGIAVNSLLDRMRNPEPIRRWVGALGPVLSVWIIVLIVGYIVGVNRLSISAVAGPLFVSVLLLHLSGFGLGYVLMKLAGKPEAFRRTVSIEVGMQNSGLGAALAKEHFPQYAVAPVPAAISAVYHCLIGSILAAIWGRDGSDARRSEADDVGEADRDAS